MIYKHFKNEKNILFIIESLKGGGGAEKVCTMIGSKLKEKGYNIHFLTFYDYKDLYIPIKENIIH